jgi:AcrR family transcriptional regulator
VTQLRADAQRNLERVLDAAAEVFAERGADVSVDEVARRAGVGHATVFRRFPTKVALVAAVVEQRMRIVADAAEAALELDDAGAALREFAEEATALHAADRCLVEATAFVAGEPGVVEQRERTLDAVGRLVRRAQDEGVLRTDLEPIDVPLLLMGVTRAAANFRAVEPELWRRYLAIVLDGLRPQAASSLPVAAPTLEQIELARHSVAG